MMFLYSVMYSPKCFDDWNYPDGQNLFHSFKEALLYLCNIQMDIVICGDKVNNYNFAIISSIQFKED